MWQSAHPPPPHITRDWTVKISGRINKHERLYSKNHKRTPTHKHHLWYFIDAWLDMTVRVQLKGRLWLGVVSLRHVFTAASSSWPLVCAVVTDERAVFGELSCVNVAVLVQRRGVIARLWTHQWCPATFQWLAVSKHRHQPKQPSSQPWTSLSQLNRAPPFSGSDIAIRRWK